jgi:hypothetical protein
MNSLQERLASSASALERLDREYSFGSDQLLAQAIERRIIWRELLDLELQNFDEKIEQLLERADTLVADPDNGHSE